MVKNKRMRGFTLIELIAVLVIMTILALIVTPLVLNIIRKARISADKRSIDAYGRSIELAIVSYLLDTGKFPTSIDQLTIEYSGDEVVCSTTQLNSDSSVYLTGCTVAGRSVDYTYGKNTSSSTAYQAYNVGDHVSYNGVTYYVIEDSDESNDTVKLLKEHILTYSELESLNLSDVNVGSANEVGVIDYENSIDYSQSSVKKVVDAWKSIAVKSSDSAIARLITLEELQRLGYSDEMSEAYSVGSGVWYYAKTDNVPSWVYAADSNLYSFYDYWTMSRYDTYKVWCVDISGNIQGFSSYRAVRPLLELNKTADIIKLDS